MKRILSLIFAFLICFMLCSPAFSELIGTTYYIDSVNGNNENSGRTEDEAFKDFSNLLGNTYYGPGDKILLKRGSKFTQMLSVDGCGTEDNPILISAYGEGSNPVITMPELSYNPLLFLHNVSYLILENIDFKDNYNSLFIYPTDGYIMSNIEVRNCGFYNLSYKPDDPDIRCNAIQMDYNSSSIYHDIYIHDLTFVDCGGGIETKGIDRETDDIFIDEKTSYNYNVRFENLYMENLLYDGIILGSLRDSVVTKCRFINTCQSNAFVTAPLWTHHCNNVTMEYCEICGSNGNKDGMTIDFDGWSTNCTYQYIYSHDNKRFMRNCLYDSETHNRNNTVRYCLSVNDNRGINYPSFAIPNDTGFPTTSDNFSFYNNTLINCSPILWINLKNVTIKDNIFIGNTVTAITSIFMLPISFGKNTIEGNVCHNYYSLLFNNSIMKKPEFAGGDTDSMYYYMLKEDSPYAGKGCFTQESMAEMAKIPTE